MGYIEINKENFFNNLEIISQKAGAVDRVAPVLKDNAYGHGLEIMATLSREFGITKAVVRTLLEAETIRNYFRDIIVLSEVPKGETHKKFSVVANSLHDLKKLAQDVSIELKIDTGMHRNGIAVDEIVDALEIIKKNRLKLKGVMTHYRSADELSSELFWQRKRFEYVKSEVERLYLDEVRFHSHNSAALFRNSEFNEDLVRVGIGAYGCLELPSAFTQPELRPVLSLWAEKIATRRLKKGERVGYSGAYEASEDMIASTYDIGYADGFSRVGSYVAPNGERLLGRVSMDNISLSSTKERVMLFNDANCFAKARGTIGYEVLTSLSPILERMVV